MLRMAAKMYNLASCGKPPHVFPRIYANSVIFHSHAIYDMFITFGDEVEKIWKQKFTVATVLWFMVRTLLSA